MPRSTTTFTSRLHLLTFMVLAVFFAAGPLTPVADAALRGCRSDPVVILSDGTILDVQAEIGTSVSNVREIHYVVHGPPGVSLVAAISTPTIGFTGKETFTYYADSRPGVYVTETLVHTSINGVPVTSHTTFAKTTIFSGISLWVEYAPVKGFNGETLRHVLTR
ncbi:MAG TPA: hypothetical protein PKC19_17580 [Roseiflexaceae bacterium]|nr:hypothetical protein [Roseiflexaceae bacterium]